MGLRNLAKRILGVERRPAYYLPGVWCAALGR
jgi:hypothetical protein